MAAIAGMEALKEPCEIVLTSDSKYLTDAINKGWIESWKAKGWKKADKSPVLNVELWKRIDALISLHKVEFVWVQGHAGNAKIHRHTAKTDLTALSVNVTVTRTLGTGSHASLLP